MNKDQLKAELLNKVKPGIKPSQLKKQTKNSSTQFNQQGLATPPDSPILPPRKVSNSPSSLDLKDQATNRHESPVKNQDKSLIKQLQQDVHYWSNTAQIHLTNLQLTMAQLDQAELTIQNLQAKNEKLSKAMQNLEKQTKNKPPIKDQSTQTLPEPKEPKLYLFTCDICEQNKKSQLHLAKVNGLGIDPTKTQKICDACLRKVDLIQAPQEDFF